jgi:hypothetical protein
MKKILFVLVAFFPALAWAGPALTFDTDKHDFGSVRQGAQLEYTFEFVNSGTNDLIIENVKTS